MALFGSITHLRTQIAPPESFAAALAYLDDLLNPGSAAAARLRSIAVGETRRLELPGGAFALEQVYLSKARVDGFFESHRKYIDVQVVCEGEEWMEVADTGRSVVHQAYLPERDLVVYADITDASRLHLQSGDAAVFHPVDVHMPGLCGKTGSALVRKTVIKVPVAG